MKIIVSYIFYTKNALNLVALSVNDVFKFQIMPHAPIYCYKPEKKRRKKENEIKNFNLKLALESHYSNPESRRMRSKSDHVLTVQDLLCTVQCAVL